VPRRIVKTENPPVYLHISSLVSLLHLSICHLYLFSETAYRNATHLSKGREQEQHNQNPANMGNAASAEELARASSLQQQLADLEHAMRMRSTARAPQWHAILPHQVLIGGAVLSTCEGASRH
jgi:hypothetical protein